MKSNTDKMNEKEVKEMERIYTIAYQITCLYETKIQVSKTNRG